MENRWEDGTGKAEIASAVFDVRQFPGIHFRKLKFRILICMNDGGSWEVEKGGRNGRLGVAGAAKNLGVAFVEQIKKLVDAPVQFCSER